MIVVLDWLQYFAETVGHLMYPGTALLTWGQDRLRRHMVL